VVAGAGEVWWRIHSRGKSRVPWTAGEGEEGWFGASWSYNIIGRMKLVDEIERLRISNTVVEI